MLIPPMAIKFRQSFSMQRTSSWPSRETRALPVFPMLCFVIGAISVSSINRSYVANTSSVVTGLPSDQRARGSSRKRKVILSSEMCQCVAS